MMEQYIYMALTYVLVLVLYWELLEMKGPSYDPAMTALLVLPVVMLPVISVGYYLWYRHRPTRRKRFTVRIDRGVMFITAAFMLSNFN